MGAVKLGDRLFLALAYRFRSHEPSSAQGTGRSRNGPSGCTRQCDLVPGGWPWATSAEPLASFVMIIGISFGIQHIKLALIALAPVGMTVVK